MADIDINKLKKWAKKFETKLVIVWEDHQNWTGWSARDSADKMIDDKDLECEHMGYYGGENSKVILLVQGKSSKNIHNCMVILKRDIISIKEVK